MLERLRCCVPGSDQRTRDRKGGSSSKGQRAEITSLALPVGRKREHGSPGVRRGRLVSAQQPGRTLSWAPFSPRPHSPSPSALPFAPASSGTWTCPRPSGQLERVITTCPSRPPDSYSIYSTASGRWMPQVVPNHSSPNICAAFGFLSSFLETLFSLDSEGPACSWF